jgi:hypothetical protein
MAALPHATSAHWSPGRRLFLWSLASFGLSSKSRKSEKSSAPAYHFATPECEVRMTVQCFARSEAHPFRFRDQRTNRAFCLPDIIKRLFFLYVCSVFRLI